MKLGDRVEVKIPGANTPELATITLSEEEGIWTTTSSIGTEVHLTFDKNGETVGYAILHPQWYYIDKLTFL